LPWRDHLNHFGRERVNAAIHSDHRQAHDSLLQRDDADAQNAARHLLRDDRPDDDGLRGVYHRDADGGSLGHRDAQRKRRPDEVRAAVGDPGVEDERRGE
jgi:hypothetical protein